MGATSPKPVVPWEKQLWLLTEAMRIAELSMVHPTDPAYPQAIARCAREAAAHMTALNDHVRGQQDKIDKLTRRLSTKKGKPTNRQSVQT